MKFADELLADVPKDVYLRVLRAFFGADPDGDHPSNILLESLLEAPRFFKHAVAVAFAAGRESAYDRNKWRVRSSKLFREWSIGASLDAAEESLHACRQHYPDAWIEHSRSGSTPWERVPDVGGTDGR